MSKKELLISEKGLEKRVDNLSFKEAKDIYEIMEESFLEIKDKYNSAKPHNIKKEDYQIINEYFQTLQPLSVAQCVEKQFYFSDFDNHKNTLKYKIENLMENIHRFTTNF